MPFAYTMNTISGSVLNGGSGLHLMRAIGQFMTNSLGWTLVEDRSDQPVAANSKYIVKSAGEGDTRSTTYLILSSGTSAEIGIQAATFWDTGTHTVGTGVASPAASTSVTLLATEDKNVAYWISGDKDSVTVVTKVNMTYDAFHSGFITPFNSSANDPFPFYLVGGASSDTATLVGSTSSAFTFLNGTTALVANEADWFSLYNSNPFSTAHGPENIFGATEKFVCVPMLAAVSDASPVRRSVRGIAKNIWSTVGPSTTSIMPEDVFQASTGRTYQVFYDASTNVQALVIRRS